MKIDNNKLFLNIHMVRSSGVWDLPESLICEDDRMFYPSEEKKKMVIKAILDCWDKETKLLQCSLSPSNIIDRCFYGDDPIISFDEKHEISTHICRPQYDTEYDYNDLTGERISHQYAFFSGIFYSFCSVDLRNLMGLFDYDNEKVMELLHDFIKKYISTSPKGTVYSGPNFLHLTITKNQPCPLYEAFNPPLSEREGSTFCSVEKLCSYIKDNPVYMTSPIKAMVIDLSHDPDPVFGELTTMTVLLKTLREYLDELNGGKE